MLMLLLENNAEVGEALLHAINEENVEAVELILEHEDSKLGKPLIKWVSLTDGTYKICPLEGLINIHKVGTETGRRPSWRLSLI